MKVVPQSSKKREISKRLRRRQQRRFRLSNFRLLIAWSVLVAGALGLVFRMYQLQIQQQPELLWRARHQQMVAVEPFIPRRTIVDSDGNVLAFDQQVYTLYAHPKLFKPYTREVVANKLSPILNVSESQLLKQFLTRETGIKVATALPEAVASQISHLKVNGLETSKHYLRFYPSQSLDAAVVGYVDVNRRGQAGVEYSQEKLLQRPPQSLELTQTGGGAVMPDYTPPDFMHTDDRRLQLTIHNGLQRVAQYSLEQGIKQFGAKHGTLIAMDAEDGSILAMVSEPSYDPNKYYEAKLESFQNSAVSELYEPGSTLKPLNVAIGLEAGAIKPSSTFYDSGQIKVGGWTIRNAEGEHHGLLNISQILEYSSNVCMVQVMQQMKPADYYHWLRRLGLGQTLVTDLPSEAKSYLASFKQFTDSPIIPATAAFGQGLSLTPLQLVQLHSALANGGKLVMPHVVRGLVNSDGQLSWQPTMPSPQQIFSPTTTKTVLEMMEKVVQEGTGTPAQIPGYRIAGKTGTAQKAGAHGGYGSAQIVSFVGIFPVESPRYVVLAVVDEPQGNVFGATVAAPIVKTVMEALLTMEKIPPTEPIPPASPKPTASN